ncbi:MAG: hypothetical protein LBD57_04230 [Endomicrobium sp.]|jgi:hypothetical protein|uniref:hypothetical protein n=1 Tax=Candidatus Endomicrobiellum cubanum TaxID=3242325 RepID=UPI00282BDD59|nr:hypothetical protein [Endomicrobium sp.]
MNKIKALVHFDNRQQFTSSSDEFKHYGKKGMKWKDHDYVEEYKPLGEKVKEMASSLKRTKLSNIPKNVNTYAEVAGDTAKRKVKETAQNIKNDISKRIAAVNDKVTATATISKRAKDNVDAYVTSFTDKFKRIGKKLKAYAKLIRNA